MTDELDKNAPDALPEAGREERRRDKRYTIPPVYRRYIRLSVKKDDEAVDAVLSIFGRHGILFESPLPHDVGKRTNCILSIPRLLSRDIELVIEIKSCKQEANVFLVGAAIETIADEIWFDVFVEIHDFIIARQDTIY